MTDLDPQPTLAPAPEPTPTKPRQNITPWVLTLFLHGLIFSGAYVLYQRAMQSNQTLTKTPVPASATAITPQKDVLQTLRDSSTPIAISQEAYAPSPKVRADLPVLTTADIIAQGNAIRMQNGEIVASAVSSTALTPLSATPNTLSTTAKTTKIDPKTSEKTTTLMMDASDEALTDRDIPAKERKNAPETPIIEQTVQTKTDKKGTTTKTAKIQKTDLAHQNSTEADKLSKELEETNADLSRNIDIVKNKNRQKIAKEFNTKPIATADKEDDSLHSEDVPNKK